MQSKSFVIFLITGLLAGFLASFIVGGGGLIRYLITGVVGSFVGGFLVQATGINFKLGNSFITQVATSTIGAILVVLAARFIA